MFRMLKSATFHLSTFDCFYESKKLKKLTLEGDFETQKQHKCWTGQKKQFVALKGKAKIKSANFQMLMKNCGWKSRGFRFLSRVGFKVEICLKVFQ